MIRKPLIKTKLPGPKARKIVQRDKRIMSPSYTRSYPLVIDHARGLWVRDPDGNVFLDFTAGIAVTSTGHCHPQVVRAIRQQTRRYLHMSGTDFYYEPQVELAERLVRHMPGNDDRKVFFTNSGTEAVEAAFKLARYITKREKIISFFGAFHGRTFGSLSLTGSKIRQREKFGPLVPGVHHVPFPNPYRSPFSEKLAVDDACIKYIEDNLFRRTVSPREVSAIILEPIQGEGGYIVPPKDFYRKLSKICKQYGILLIADEVQSGMGRTGKFFAIEHFGVVPDIITLAKGIASGMPLGAMIARSSLMKWEPGSHASTFGGNPVACAAALATLNLLEKGLIRNAEVMGNYLRKGLERIAKRRKIIGDIRGLGLMQAIELVRDRKKKTFAQKEQGRVVERAFRKGLLLLGCGESSIRFSPALNVKRNEIDTMLEILDDCLRLA